MSFAADGITVFAVLMSALQPTWATSTWVAMALLCLGGWVLIVLDLRGPQQHEAADERSAVRPRSTGTDVIF